MNEQSSNNLWYDRVNGIISQCFISTCDMCNILNAIWYNNVLHTVQCGSV